MEGVYWVYVFLIVFVRQTIENGQFDWTVQQEVSKYGENLTLMCVVGGCCAKQAGWGKWIPDFTTVFIDVKNLVVSPSSKYDAQVYRNGFTLVIRQLNETDLNIAYSCTYGYSISTKKILTKELAFKNKTDDGQSNSGNWHRRTIKYLLAFVLPALCFCVIIGIAVMLRKMCTPEDHTMRHIEVSDTGINTPQYWNDDEEHQAISPGCELPTTPSSRSCSCHSMAPSVYIYFNGLPPRGSPTFSYRFSGRSKCSKGSSENYCNYSVGGSIKSYMARHDGGSIKSFMSRHEGDSSTESFKTCRCSSFDNLNNETDMDQ